MLMRIIAGAALASRPKGVAIMARMGFVAAASASAVLLSTYGACAAERVAGVGDVVLRVEKTEPLPNVFGGPDIFGRRRPTGVDMIQFMGLRDGKAVFVRSGVAIQSNATTLTESPRYVPTPSFGTFSRPSRRLVFPWHTEFLWRHLVTAARLDLGGDSTGPY